MSATWTRRPIKTIKANPNNPRLIKDERFQKLVQSIKDFPQMLELRPIVVNAAGVVLGGNMRLKACQAAGLTEVPVIAAESLTEAQEREFIIKDNVGFGEWEWDALANAWDAAELTAWGLDLPNFEAETAAGQTDPDEVPSLPTSPITQLGDVWQIGRHRLICGDSTDTHVIAALFAGKTADLCFTSPPYALGKSIALRGNSAMSAKANAYDNHDDNPADWLDLMNGWWASSLDVVTKTWIVNVQPLAGNKRQLIEWIHNRADRLIDVLTWDKGHGPPQIAPGVVSSRYEWLIGFGNSKASRSFPLASWQGTVQSVYEGPAQRNNEYADIHAATMPVHLPTWVIGTLCDQAKTVFDPFTGTGTTMMACEQLGRTFFGVEISPQYCDVTVNRWEKFTGHQAKRISD